MNWDILLQQVLNGLVLGSVYALVALGYTMVYGILQLINFAHGEILMIGAMVGMTMVTQVMAGTSIPGWFQLLIAVVVAVPVCVIVSLLMERLAYRPLRNAPRLSPLITAIGLSIMLQTLAMIIWSPSPQVFPDLLSTDPVKIGGAILGPKQLLILGVTAVMMAGLVLLDGSISADYDLNLALSRCSEGIVNFYNLSDVALLEYGTGLMGNVDGGHGASAGLKGFTGSFAGLYQVQVTQDMVDDFESPHFADCSQAFTAQYIAPWVIDRGWPPSHIRLGGE